ncbi:hypothetical protein K439DRAFT_1617699 [Ramaria rubella]|nr:hypothetical protein K439DRAFT_1617699 [Ramaria rubella]
MANKPPGMSHSTSNTDTLTTKLENLHEIIHTIALLKTKAAKTCTISVDMLCNACDLITLACTIVKDSYFDSRISNTFKKLESISAYIGLAMPSNQPHSYASVLANMSTTQSIVPPELPTPHHDTTLELTLVQSNQNTPVFVNLSDSELLSKTNKALIDTQCWYETAVYSPDSNGNEHEEHSTVHIHAVGCHQSSDIWISTCSKDEWDHLIETAHHWLPTLSGHLHITPKTYPILVHGIPISFETCDSDDIAALLDENPQTPLSLSLH